jgi:subtilase family serine protease
MILTLQPSAAQQSALEALTAQLQDPGSPNFHRFLTPAQFAAAFGASQSDVDKVTAWLSSQGFHVDEVVPNHLAIVFSGTAAQVQAAFHTEIRQYLVNGEMHDANASAPQMPAELGSLVQGLVRIRWRQPLRDPWCRPTTPLSITSVRCIPPVFPVAGSVSPSWAGRT